MRRIEAAERGEELPAFQLQTERKARRLEECFFELDLRLVIVVELQDDVREAFEERIDSAIECDLRIAGVEAALLRIVVADFDVVNVTRARGREREHAVERD